MSTPPARSFPRADHDHDRCVAAALDEAAAICAERRVRFTPLRRRVLEIVWQGHRPAGAYAILEQLGAEGRSSAPPTVYRALEFLLEQGLVHRIASLNAFVGCARPGHGGEGQFLICERCGEVAELNDPGVDRAIERSSEALGFRTGRHTVEITGTCPRCRRSRS